MFELLKNRCTKAIAIVILLSYVVCILTGCRLRGYIDEKKFDAKFCDYGNEYISEDFLKENKVKAYYRNENFNEKEEHLENAFIYEKEAPEERLFVIEDEETFNKIFIKHEGSLDFENQKVILYIFPSIYSRKYFLTGINEENGILTVQVRLERSKKDDAGMPSPRCFLLVIKNIDFNFVVFEKI